MLDRIKEMHDKFGMNPGAVPFSDEEKAFRIAAMQEELNEYIEASNSADELDALVDLVVFALGTADRQGMIDIFEEAYNRVMDANIQKIVGTNSKRGSFKLDLVKPEGWTAPDFSDIIELKGKDIR